ncbi:MAG: Nudix family hydrolase [Phaeospirillum sp.]|nr:Nudix family hydrolase [Phaeospirillum sp.]
MASRHTPLGKVVFDPALKITLNNSIKEIRLVDVAAAVILRSDGSFLLAQRPAGKVYEGYWEFPGGKIEAGETPLHALRRELHEELGITATTAFPWLTRVFTYPHATVRLHFFRVTEWQGELHGHEGQQFAWQPPTLPRPLGVMGKISVSPVLPANAPILRALELPYLYAISNAAELGVEEFMRRLESALQNGLRLLQLRENNLPRSEMRALSLRAVKLAHAHGAQALINGDIGLARETGADGLHLSSVQLAACDTRPDVPWCGASCHNAEELQRAGMLGLDFAVLSPVLPTRSHPGAAHLGWEKFAEMVAGTAIPVYALGGLAATDLPVAQRHGAHGIALLRQAW